MNDLLPEIQYYPIYWKDGMHVSSLEFFASDCAMQDWIRDARALYLNKYNYGLLPSDHEEPDNYPHLHCSNDKQFCTVQVIACRAITAGGGRIEITPDSLRHGIPLHPPSTKINLSSNSKYDIYISILPFDQPEEAGKEIRDTPPGRRYATLAYQLSSNGNSERQVSAIQGAYSLKIAEFIVDNGLGHIDTNYIPPCSQMNNHPHLLKEYKIIEKQLEEILDLGINIIRDYRPKRNNPLEGDITFFAEKFVFFLASSLPTFKSFAPNQPPIYTIAYVCNLMKLVQTALNCVDYEKNINAKFSNIKNIKDSSNIISTPNEINHDNIKPSLDKVEGYLTTFSKLLEDFTGKKTGEIKSGVKWGR